MRQVPYIGITDFTSADQVAVMRALLDEEGCRHLLHVGVMMSYKTLRDFPTRWANVFPPKEALRDIFVEREGVMHVLHYADYDDQSGVDEWLEALEWAGPAVDAIQLDMPWPNRYAVQELREKLGVKIIIQVGHRAVELASNDPNEVARRLLQYHLLSCVDYTLFDMSGGKGIPMAARDLLSQIWVSIVRVPELNVAIAGGLGPKSMDLADLIVRDLSREGIPVSFDAQSKLRPSGDATYPIDWTLAAEYLHRAAQLLRRYESPSA